MTLNSPFSNPAAVLWGLAAIGLVALSSEVPLLGQALKVTLLSPLEWVVIVVSPLLTTSWWEVWKLLRWRRNR